MTKKVDLSKLLVDMKISTSGEATALMSMKDAAQRLAHPNDGAYPLLRYLANVAATIRAKGWVSDARSKRDQSRPTYQAAWERMLADDQLHDASDWLAAKESIAWIVPLDQDVLSLEQRSYFDHLLTVMRMPEISYAQAAMAASIYRAIEKVAVFQGAATVPLGTVRLPEQIDSKSDKTSPWPEIVFCVRSVDRRFLTSGIPVDIIRARSRAGDMISVYVCGLRDFMEFELAETLWLTAHGHEASLPNTWLIDQPFVSALDANQTSLVLTAREDLRLPIKRNGWAGFSFPAREPTNDLLVLIDQVALNVPTPEGIVAGNRYRISGRYVPDINLIDQVREIVHYAAPQTRAVLWDDEGESE
jgi:hypothetical protein